MGGAVTIVAENDSQEHILRLWDQVSAFEDTPSMRALRYPPHLSLAIYEDIDQAQLRDAVETVFGGQSKVTLTFRAIRHFDIEPLVLWAAPDDADVLQRRHAALHETIDPQLCHPHYRPGAWVAHCTLATRIADDRRQQAVEFAAAGIQPFELVFDRADCVSFQPVQVTWSVGLEAPRGRGGESSEAFGRHRGAGLSE